MVGTVEQAGRALPRSDFFGRNFLMMSLVFTMLFSGGLIPLYLVVLKLGLMNTRWAMLLPEALVVWFVIIARTYFQTSIPDELAEAASIDGSRDTMRALANRPDDLIVGAYAAGHALMGAQEEGIWQQYRVVPPLRGPGGVQLTAYRPYMPNFGRFAITNKASEAVQQRAMELANWFYTTQGTLEMGAGIGGPESEGFYWDWAGPDDIGLNGEPAIYLKLPPPPMSEVTNYKWHTEFRFWHKELFNGWAASQDIMTRDGYERFLVVESDKYIDHVPAEVVPASMYFAPEDAQLTAQLQVEIQNYVEQNTVAFITGQRDLDTEWDSYVQGFEGLRLAHYLEVMQRTYDDFQ